MGKVLMMRKGEIHTTPISGIFASDIAVGSTVYLMENGSPVEYLVVNQGIPSNSSLYDSSCDGMWLLRKDIYTTLKYDDGETNSYKDSSTHEYLNSTFLSVFDAVVQSAILQVKIPYVNGNGKTGTVATGANGLSTKVFLLSLMEAGLAANNLSEQSAILEYFSGYPEGDAIRIAKYNGTAKDWWTRSPNNYYTYQSYYVTMYGQTAWDYSTYTKGIRPALILPFNALFDKNTLVLKGVA